MLKPLERNDGKTKQKISKMVGEGEVKGARGSGIIVTSLPLQLETKIDKVREAPSGKKRLNFGFLLKGGGRSNPNPKLLRNFLRNRFLA